MGTFEGLFNPYQPPCKSVLKSTFNRMIEAKNTEEVVPENMVDSVQPLSQENKMAYIKKVLRTLGTGFARPDIIFEQSKALQFLTSVISCEPCYKFTTKKAIQSKLAAIYSEQSKRHMDVFSAEFEALKKNDQFYQLMGCPFNNFLKYLGSNQQKRIGIFKQDLIQFRDITFLKGQTDQLSKKSCECLPMSTVFNRCLELYQQTFDAWKASEESIKNVLTLVKNERQGLLQNPLLKTASITITLYGRHYILYPKKSGKCFKLVSNDPCLTQSLSLLGTADLYKDSFKKYERPDQLVIDIFERLIDHLFNAQNETVIATLFCEKRRMDAIPKFVAELRNIPHLDDPEKSTPYYFELLFAFI